VIFNSVVTLAAVAGAACILLLLVTVIRLERRRTEGQPIRNRLDFYARSRKLWLAMMCSVGGFALAFATFSHADAPNPSAIGSAIPAIGALQESLAALHGKIDVIGQRTSDIQEDTQAIRRAVDPQDDRGRLARLGYGIDEESKARAIEACDIDAIRLFTHLNESMPLALPILGKRGGSTLEAPILAKNEHFETALKILSSQPQFDKSRLSAPLMLTFTQAQTRSIPLFEGLLIQARRRGLTYPCGLVALGALVPQRQTFGPVQAIDAFVIVFPAFPLQHHVHPAVAVMDARGCNLFDARKKRRRVAGNRAVPVQRARHVEQRASLGQAHAVAVTQLVNQRALAGRLQSFFDSTSCSIALSRLRSATSRLSFAFSSSSCRIRRSSEGPTPPYFFFQL
jgi:hypothetical protein